MAMCGLVDVKLMLNLIDCWLHGKFAPCVTVLAGVCVGGKGHLNFVDDKAKVITAYTGCGIKNNPLRKIE